MGAILNPTAGPVVRTQDLERGEVTAYQDGVWLGRAIVAVDAMAPGEAPPERNYVVRFVGSCVVRGGCWGQALGSSRSSPRA